MVTAEKEKTASYTTEMEDFIQTKLVSSLMAEPSVIKRRN